MLYLFLGRQEKLVLRYDFLSIFFTAMIGTLAIAFAVLNSTGLLGKVEEVAAREERSFDLPVFSYDMDTRIKRVVVRNAGYDATIESTSTDEISVFGTYRVQTKKREKQLMNVDDYLMANQIGDTLYIDLKMLPNDAGPFHTQGAAAVTILIPNDVELEAAGENDSLTLKPRSLKNNWSVEMASAVTVHSSESKNLKIDAKGVEELSGREWQVIKKEKEQNQNPSGEKDALYQIGTGQYHINIVSCYQVSLLTGE
ncbi:hypothetical protein [Neobacillus mesonae]|uniref:hypothetical protein n=1 Tax=Neobacillus mesonae TaxID=1193713 RepID=UPI00203D98DC|nr:hypothetical protein [Neobacillus mesonae]MCM3570462.1 hypothetical protein [Neobacillus mesonae]